MISVVRFPLFLLAAAMAAHAGAIDPGTAALDFLEKVRQRKIDLQPGGDTALSPETGATKRDEIRLRLDRMARDIGSDPLELGEIKQDENFAAVLVRKTNSFDPSRLRIFPIAVVKRGEKWAAAPVPASFENAGAGYPIAMRKRLESLEMWMQREQVVDLEKLRANSVQRMRTHIESRLPARELRALTAKQAAERFLMACEQNDLPSVLGMLGGLAAIPPDDWAIRLRAASEAIRPTAGADSPWRLLTAPEILRFVEEKSTSHDHATAEVTCLDPNAAGNGKPRIEMIAFDLTRTADQMWQVRLPAGFLQGPADQPRTTKSREALAFTSKWTQAHPPVPQPSAATLHGAWLAALREPTLAPLLAVATFPTDSAVALDGCLTAAKLWSMFQDSTAVRHIVPLDFHASDAVGCALVAIMSPRTPDTAELMPAYFEKSPTGWLWAPTPAPSTTASLRQWVADGTAKWRNRWQEILLRPSPVVTDWDGPQPPTRHAAQQCVETWLEACRRGDVAAALPTTARMDSPKSAAELLRNLGFEIAGLRRTTEKITVTSIYQGRVWTAVGVKMDLPGSAPSYPLYPVIQTPQGPRILAEISLSASRARDFLNKTAFERLHDAGTPEASMELRTLFAEHQEHIERLLKKAVP